MLEEDLLQEALSSRYDTGKPHRGLANFHEILTTALLNYSELVRHSKMVKSARVYEAQKIPNSSGDHFYYT